MNGLRRLSLLFLALLGLLVALAAACSSDEGGEAAGDRFEKGGTNVGEPVTSAVPTSTPTDAAEPTAASGSAILGLVDLTNTPAYAMGLVIPDDAAFTALTGNQTLGFDVRRYEDNGRLQAEVYTLDGTVYAFNVALLPDAGAAGDFFRQVIQTAADEGWAIEPCDIGTEGACGTSAEQELSASWFWRGQVAVSIAAVGEAAGDLPALTNAMDQNMRLLEAQGYRLAGLTRADVEDWAEVVATVEAEADAWLTALESASTAEEYAAGGAEAELELVISCVVSRHFEFSAIWAAVAEPCMHFGHASWQLSDSGDLGVAAASVSEGLDRLRELEILVDDLVG